MICFTGFKSKEELHHLCCLAHHMGASIRKDMVSAVTHIVARVVNGSKYKVRTCMVIRNPNFGPSKRKMGERCPCSNMSYIRDAVLESSLYYVLKECPKMT